MTASWKWILFKRLLKNNKRKLIKRNNRVKIKSKIKRIKRNKKIIILTNKVLKINFSEFERDSIKSFKFMLSGAIPERWYPISILIK